jgi:holo-[acyl-carrier protein] synthase
LSVRGVGVDIVSVARVEQLLRRHDSRFLARCFRPEELPADADGLPRVDFAAQVAGRWAVKEACLKALGCLEALDGPDMCFCPGGPGAIDGDVRGIPYRDIEVRRAAGGAPCVVLHGRAAAVFASGGGCRVLASLSHEREVAVGFVVIDG